MGSELPEYVETAIQSAMDNAYFGDTDSAKQRAAGLACERANIEALRAAILRYGDEARAARSAAGDDEAVKALAPFARFVFGKECFVNTRKDRGERPEEIVVLCGYFDNATTKAAPSGVNVTLADFEKAREVYEAAFKPAPPARGDGGKVQ